MMEKKKNGKYYIIPASYFQKKGIETIKVNLDTTPKVAKESNSQENSKQESKPETQNFEQPKIVLTKNNKTTSGLSLKSIQRKKEHLIKQMDVVLEEEDLPKEHFTEEALLSAWNNYVDKIEKQGKFNLASILRIDTPKVKGTDICLEFPNETNKVELERNQYELLGYIRQKLSNYDISLSITVNEEMEKQYAYTPIEKYEKLKEKNSNIELLRKTFDLDI